MVADEPSVNLDTERQEAENAWRAQGVEYMSLSVAAAITFHQACGSTKVIVTCGDYDDALNLAASALSRLVPLFTLAGDGEAHVPVVVDLTRQQFARGARMLRFADGSGIRDLSVRYADLADALQMVKRAGIVLA